MKLTFAPRGILQIDDARITFKNFEGRGDQYNRPGDRNFALVISDPDIADELANKGWNVSIKPPRTEGDEPFMFMKVKVKYNEKDGRGPSAYLKSGQGMTRLTEDTIGLLDKTDILSVDLDIRPYDWEMPGGKSGRTAYLQSIHVTQRVDRFAERYANEEDEF